MSNYKGGQKIAVLTLNLNLFIVLQMLSDALEKKRQGVQDSILDRETFHGSGIKRGYPGNAFVGMRG